MAFSRSGNGSIINFDDNSNNVVYRSVQLNETKQPSTLGNGSNDFTTPLYDNDSSSTFRAIGGGFTLAQDSDNGLSGLAPLPSLSSAKQLTLSSVHTNAAAPSSFDSLMDAWPYTAPMNSAKELSFVALSASPAHDHDDCPPVPVYVEQYTTFTVGRKSVFDDIAAHLTSIGVDHSVHDHKIRGLVYPADRAGACEFRVYRYRCDHAGQWLIEVQRRSGCIFAFNQLYRSIVACTSSSHTDNNGTAPTPSLASLPPLPKLSSGSATAEPTGDLVATVEPLTVKQLTTMASSNAVEVAREGIEALAVLSSMSSGHAAAVASATKALSLPLSLLTIAATMVATARAPTARAAADLIANIAASSREGSSLALSCPTMVSSLFTMLDAPSSLSLRDTKRHCARAIASMASSDLATLRKATHAYDALPTSAFTCVAILERYTGVDDVALRTSVLNALALLR